MEDENKFARDRKLDPDALDVECVKQADTFFEWAKKAVHARAKVDDLKLKMDLVLSECQLKIRRNPKKYDLDKVTDPAIKAAAESHPKYQQAIREHHEAKVDSAILDKAVQALEMKKKALDNLIILHGQAYFAGPTTPRNLSEIWKKSQKVSEDKLTQRMIRVQVEADDD